MTEWTCSCNNYRRITIILSQWEISPWRVVMSHGNSDLIPRAARADVWCSSCGLNKNAWVNLSYRNGLMERDGTPVHWDCVSVASIYGYDIGILLFITLIKRPFNHDAIMEKCLHAKSHVRGCALLFRWRVYRREKYGGRQPCIPSNVAVLLLSKIKVHVNGIKEGCVYHCFTVYY